MTSETQLYSKKYKLVRERDNLTKEGNRILWIDWDTDGTFHSSHYELKLDRSLILDPHHMSYTWMTTIVTEIIEQREDYIKFRTTNSVYELFIEK
jgi:diphthamide synthase subunit DPH2